MCILVAMQTCYSDSQRGIVYFYEPCFYVTSSRREFVTQSYFFKKLFYMGDRVTFMPLSVLFTELVKARVISEVSPFKNDSFRNNAKVFEISL